MCALKTLDRFREDVEKLHGCGYRKNIVYLRDEFPFPCAADDVGEGCHFSVAPSQHERIEMWGGPYSKQAEASGGVEVGIRARIQE